MSVSVLQRGDQLIGELTGAVYSIEEFLGGGGQGEVYRVSGGPQPLAVKWYFAASATSQQREALAFLSKKGPPDGRFLWPIELVISPTRAGFGYVMGLRPHDFRGVNELLAHRVTTGFCQLVTAALHLVGSFWMLHSKGLCYRDISDGNVFINPSNGDILICDNDNVGVNHRSHAGILGTPGFMAPEIVVGKALPSSETDRFSLAVLLFEMLMFAHPLRGQAEYDVMILDFQARVRLYGEEPIFIFDPANASNRPVKGEHDNALIYWPLYPTALRELFTKSFCQGLKDPDRRVGETLWKDRLVQARDGIFPCASCGRENFYDTQDTSGAATTRTCWGCRKPLVLAPRLKIISSKTSADVVMLNVGTRLFPHHIANKAHIFRSPMAEVVPNPKNPGQLGLRNLSDNKWLAIRTDGTSRETEPGAVLPISDRLKVQFGAVDALVRQ